MYPNLINFLHTGLWRWNVGRNAEQYENQQSINDPANESSLWKGKCWHDNSNP